MIKDATKFISTLLLFLTISGPIKGQTLRYFEFKTRCFTNGNNTWEDSSFIAATSDTIVIDSIYADLSRPETMRKMIIGPVDTGNGGYNHNASHWFLWHFIEDQWSLAYVAIELCDACPTGVDACVVCFIQINAFCPWSSYVSKEINFSGMNEFHIDQSLQIFPNPFTGIITFTLNNNQQTEIILYDITSRKLMKENFINSVSLNTEQLAAGIYIYELRGDRGIIKNGKIFKQ